MSQSLALTDGAKGTAGRIIKVNHAGEFGAVNIYRAQLLVARLLIPGLAPTLQEFMKHERRHLQTFGHVLQTRGIPRCKSYWLCGIGGFCLGLITALFGRAGIMACTAAVETVVTKHLVQQLVFLKAEADTEAFQAVQSILQEELEHKELGVAQGKSSIFFKPLGLIVSGATSGVIWLGMQL